MDDVAEFFKKGIRDLHKQAIQKSYQQKQLKDRMEEFNDIRRQTRASLMYQKRKIDLKNLSPFNTPVNEKISKKPVIQLERKPSQRLEMLKKWKIEKGKKKQEEKQKSKPVFKVYHIPVNVGLPNLEMVNKNIKGKPIKAQEVSKFAPKNHVFKPPANIKPLHFKSEPIKKETLLDVKHKVTGKNENLLKINRTTVTSNDNKSNTSNVSIKNENRTLINNKISSSTKVSNHSNKSPNISKKAVNKSPVKSNKAVKPNLKHVVNKPSNFEKNKKYDNIEIKRADLKEKPKIRKETLTNHNQSKVNKSKNIIDKKNVKAPLKNKDQTTQNLKAKKLGTLKKDLTKNKVQEYNFDISESKNSDILYSDDEITLKTPRKTPIKTPHEAQLKTPSKTLFITPRKTPNKTPRKTPIKTPRKTPIKTRHEAQLKTPNETSLKTPCKTPNKTPRKTPIKTPHEAQLKTPSKTSLKTPRKTPNKTPRNTPVKTPHETQFQTPIETPVKTPSKTSLKTPNKSPFKTPKKTPKKSISKLNSAATFETTTISTFEAISRDSLASQNTTSDTCIVLEPVEHTPPSNKVVESSVAYISPFVTISRGKESAIKEFKIRQSTGGSLPYSPVCENNFLASSTSPKAGAFYFSKKLDDEIFRIENLCDKWNDYKEEDVPDDIKDLIDTAVGQSRLLITKKFKQFRDLIVQCRDCQYKEKPVTCVDLHGFWDMMYMQIEDIDRRFGNLEELKGNNWQFFVSDNKEKRRNVKARSVRQTKIKAASKIKDMIKQARARKQNINNDNNIDCVFPNEVLENAQLSNGPSMQRLSILQSESIPSRASLSPGLAMMKITQAIKKGDGVTPSSILKKSGVKSERRMTKCVLFKDLEEAKEKTSVMMTELNKENVNSINVSPLIQRRRSKRLSNLL